MPENEGITPDEVGRRETRKLKDLINELFNEFDEPLRIAAKANDGTSAKRGALLVILGRMLQRVGEYMQTRSIDAHIADAGGIQTIMAGLTAEQQEALTINLAAVASIMSVIDTTFNASTVDALASAAEAVRAEVQRRVRGDAESGIKAMRIAVPGEAI